MSTKVAVLVSGTGSLLEAMIGDDLPIALVISDRPCRGLEIARSAGLPTVLVERTDFSKSFDREGFTGQVVGELKKADIGLVVCAGFMTLFSRQIFESFGGRILNIHPALLPNFKGAHAVRDALAAGVKETGTTIHLMVLSEDSGPILVQEKVPVLAGDTEETLHERIKQVERKLYLQTIRRILSGDLQLPG